MTDVGSDNREKSARKFFKTVGGSLSAYDEKNSPIYSLLSGQRVGQIPLDEHKDIDQEELIGCLNIVSVLGWAQLFAVLLVFGLGWARLAGSTASNPATLSGCMVAFAAFNAAGRWLLRKHHGSRWLLLLQSWASLLFITVGVWQTGSMTSPLLPLHFVAIMLAGMILDTRTVLTQTAFVSVCYGLMAAEAYRLANELLVQHLSGPFIRTALLWIAAAAVSLVGRELSVSKEKIRQLSRTDQLTGLWNMKMLLIFMQREYERTLMRAGKFSVLMIDADSLKAVNDTYGHQAGTVLIVAISETMRSELREEDMLARFGGDEFVAFLPETGCQEALKVAERLRLRIATAPLHFEGDEVSITVSCGIACFPDHGEDLAEIMKKADRALYYSKSQGKNCCTIFNAEAERERSRFR